LREDVETSVSKIDESESGESRRSTSDGVGEENLGWGFGWGRDASLLMNRDENERSARVAR